MPNFRYTNRLELAHKRKIRYSKAFLSEVDPVPPLI